MERRFSPPIYRYRLRPVMCGFCGMRFHSDLEKENHDRNFCFQSKYADKEYLQFVQLREKYEGGRPTKDEMIQKSWQDTFGLDREIQRGKELDRELAKLDKPGEKSFTEIERLVKVWKEQKKIQGVEDSDKPNKLKSTKWI